MLSRRSLTGLVAAFPFLAPFTVQAASRGAAPVASILPDAVARGSIDAVEHGLLPGSQAGQGELLQSLVERAAALRSPLFLPPGDYHVSGIILPSGAYLAGIPGASRLVHSGGGPMFRAMDGADIRLEGLVFDGAARPADSAFEALVYCRSVRDLVIGDCAFTASARNGLQLEACSGRIDRNRISGVAGYGILAVESAGLSITGNTVTTCGDGAILVHRWNKAADATIVSGNRISRISARSGGTGQYGNGINLYRADNVLVSGNHISDCAFSAIRANASSNALITGNQCLASGETAIYSEFGFEGAVVSGNIVDGAANGISVVNLDENGRLATITGNIVRNLSLTGPYPPEGPGFGIGIAAEGEVVVSSNTVENAPSWGMLIGWGPYLRNVVVTGNIIRDAATGIAVTVVDGAGTAMISGNLFSRVPQGAIIGYRHRARATEDLIRGSSLPHLVIENNRLS